MISPSNFILLPDSIWATVKFGDTGIISRIQDGDRFEDWRQPCIMAPIEPFVYRRLEPLAQVCTDGRRGGERLLGI